jgi:hypothetical protein
MAVFWHLSLKASNKSDAEKIKAYAKELNNIYKFDLADEDGYGGLAFFKWGFGYGTVEPDDAERFNEFINKVVANFPEMKLNFFGSGDGPCQQWEKVSKNGVLVYIEPWYMNIHCEGEHFKELLSNIGYIEQQGFEVSQNETGCSLHWEYDRKSEEEKCHSTLQHLSKQLPQAEIVCYKFESKDNVPFISEYCIMKGGEGEWIEADRTIMNLGDECISGTLEGKATIFDVIKDAGACFALALEEVRKNPSQCTTLGYIISNTENAIGLMQYFKPEDKEWLERGDDRYRTIYDAILLWGMYNRFNATPETYVDEETKEEVVITRLELQDTPLFEMEADNEARLFARLYNSEYRRECNNMHKNTIELLEFTNVDYTIILHKMLDSREFSITRGDIDDEIKWMCEKLGDIYRWGCERFGRFIDKQKAKKYYDIALITDDNPLEDEKQYQDYEDTPTSFKYTIKGDATGELKTIIEKHATESLDNEFGIYAPVNEIMHELVGTDPKQPKYFGNVLYAFVENGDLVIKGEANEPEMLGYAILNKYPALKVYIEA